MPKLRSNSITLSLVVLCGLTSAAIWWFELPGSRANDLDKPASANDSEMGNDALHYSMRHSATNKPITSYSEILERPIFRSSRRSPVETAPGSTDANQEAPSKIFADSAFSLAGVIIIDDSRFALLRTTNTQSTQSVKVGDVVDGWRITRLTPSSAAMERGDDARTLQLERNGGP